MNNFIISMKNAYERREYIQNIFNQSLISFEIFDAVSIDNKLDEWLDELPELKNSYMTAGEKGCWLSHFSLWNKCIEENLEYINIFEDDIILGKDAAKFLQNDNWLRERFDLNKAIILRFETFLQAVEQEKTEVFPFLTYSFVKIKSQHYGTAGYMITQEMAKKLIDYAKNTESIDFMPIDNWLYSYKLRDYDIYQIKPAFVVQELQYKKGNSLLGSHLEKERVENLKKNKMIAVVEKLTIKPEKTLSDRLQKFVYNIKRALSKPARIRQKREQEKYIQNNQIPFEK